MIKFLISCSIFLLLLGCSPNDSSSIHLENSAPTESYFFQSKEVDIYFPDAIDSIDIHKIKLISDGAVVAEISGKNNIIVNDKHIRILNTNQRLTHFDTVVINDDQENNIKIPVGDYYYEGQITDDTIPADKEVFIRNKHYKQINGTLIYTIDFTNIEGSTIEFAVPESINKIATLIEQKTILKTSDSITYEFHIEIPKNYFIQKKITNLNFELKADQRYESSRKTIFKSFIPINIDELNSKAP